ncbi:MAG: hypothetical protein ACMXX9_04305 [Candidatus Woesearchaeota archaeon]
MEDIFLTGSVQGFEGVLALLLGMAAVLSVVSLVIYVYLGFAFMAIGKKAKLKTPALAWIPWVGPIIIAFQASKMDWWPWLLLIGLVVPYLNFIAYLAFVVFAFMWMWKMFEAINKPGWWALTFLIPIVGFIFAGIAAWGKD